MKGLLTLIKLSKRTLDELRRKLGVLENEKSRLQEAIKKLQEELENEIALATRQPEMSGFFGGFAKRIQKRQQDIAAEIRKIDGLMVKLRDDIAAAFGELKKYEIARDNAKARATAEANRKETIMLDDIAAQQHRQKEKEKG